MEVADGPYNTQQTASNESSKTRPSDMWMSRGVPGEFPPSSMAIVCPKPVHLGAGPNNSTIQTTTQAAVRWILPSHGVSSDKEITIYRDRECSGTGTGIKDPFTGEDLMLHLANLTLELLQALSTRNTGAHVKVMTSQQKRSYCFAQKAHRARRWIWCSARQKGWAIARQQIQELKQNLNDQAVSLPTMASGARKVWALAQGSPIYIRIPSTLARMMQLLPEGIQWSINLRDRADVARVFVVLVNYWLSEAGGEATLTTPGTMQLVKAEEPGKIVEVEQIMD